MPGDVEQVIFKVLAKDPGDRFQGMGGFADVLEKLGQGVRVSVGRVAVPGEDKVQSRSPGWLVGALAGLVIALIVVVFLFAAGVVGVKTPSLPEGTETEVPAAVAETASEPTVISTQRTTPTATDTRIPAPTSTPRLTSTPQPSNTPTPKVEVPGILYQYLDNPAVVEFDDFDTLDHEVWGDAPDTSLEDGVIILDGDSEINSARGLMYRKPYSGRMGVLLLVKFEQVVEFSSIIVLTHLSYFFFSVIDKLNVVL